jgi:hypothetical protein
MAWRIPAQTDLIAVMSLSETEAFQRSAKTGEQDPADTLIANAAGVLRGYIRKAGIPMSPNPAEIPEELMGPAMDYAAFNLCKRIRISVTKERADAWTAAKDLFKEIADHKHMPEPYADPSATGGPTLPSISDPDETAVLG